MKKILFLLLLLFSQCQKLDNTNDSVMQLSLLNYRQNVSMEGTFFGIYNANVKVSQLNTNGQCDQNEITIGNTDSSGKFTATFLRYDSDMVCIKTTPKEDMTSRMLALDAGKEIIWSGNDKFNIMFLPQPSTTKRSSFNAISTPFNRMAMRRVERLAKNNTDTESLKSIVKTANRQIVSQFGLSRGLSKSARASSVELAIPDLNDITFDVTDITDPITLKFNIMIGGLHKLAIPEKPDTYNDVVKVVAEYVSSGTGSSAGEDGKPLLLPRDMKENGGSGIPLSANNSLSNKVTSAVQSFLIEKGGDLNIPAELVTQIVSQVAVNDKPTFGPVSAPTSEKSPIIEYQKNSFIFTQGSKISLFPKTENASFFYMKGDKPESITFDDKTGEISGLVNDINSYVFNITASGAGGDKSVKIILDVVHIPTINLGNSDNCQYKGTRYVECYYRSGSAFTFSPYSKGIESFTFVGGKPTGLDFDKTLGYLAGIPTNTCLKDECVINIIGEGKGGTTDIVVSFLELPHMEYMNSYVIENNIDFNIYPITVKAIQTFKLMSDLPSGLQMAENGRIYGRPTKSNISAYDVTIKGIGDAGETLTTFSLYRKPTLAYASNFKFSLENNFEIYPQESIGVIDYVMRSTLPDNIYFDNISGRIWGKITSVFSNLWQITGTGKGGDVEVTIMISSENNYAIQCNTTEVEVIQGMSMESVYCNSLGAQVSGWLLNGKIHSGILTNSNTEYFSLSGIPLESGNRNFSLQYMTEYGYSPIFNFSINVIGLPQLTKTVKWTIYNNSGIHGFANFASDWDQYFQRPDRVHAYGESSTVTMMNWDYGNQTGIPIPNGYDFYSVKVEGVFAPRKTGLYVFSCTGDDGVDLSINNNVICSHYGGHGPAGVNDHVGTYYMEMGKTYAFKARMQEQEGGDGLRIKWRKPNSGLWEVDDSELGL